jgi:hypothetical protein
MDEVIAKSGEQTPPQDNESCEDGEEMGSNGELYQ